jgi:hypothetical protein
MKVFRESLQSVLDKLNLLFPEVSDSSEDNDIIKSQKLYERLEKTLIDHNSDCVAMVENIQKLPGTEQLVQQIEDFEFEQALFTLRKLRAGG